MGYIIFFAVSTWNIVTSVFVDKALRLSRPDLETLAMDKSMQEIADGKELLALIHDAGFSHNGQISKRDFNTLLQHPKFISCLQVRGIAINNVELFFKMLRTLSHEEDIDVQTFVAAMLRMKGFATSIDLHSLDFQV